MDDTKLDATLLRLLQIDGRMSVKEISAQLGVPRAAAARRLQQLLGSGAIRVVAALDPEVAGYRHFIHALVQTNGESRATAERLSELDETVFVSSIAGTFSLAFEARFATEDAKTQVLAYVRNLPQVRKIVTTTYVKIAKGFSLAQRPTEVRLDQTDHKLIAGLETNGRSTYQELAKLAGTSVSTARERVVKLLESRVVRISAVESRGLRNSRIGMGVGIVSRDPDGVLLEYLRKSAHIDFAAVSHGQFDFVATLVASNPAQVYAVLEDVRKITPLGDVEAWPQLHVFKESYTRALQVEL